MGYSPWGHKESDAVRDCSAAQWLKSLTFLVFSFLQCEMEMASPLPTLEGRFDRIRGVCP